MNEKSIHNKNLNQSIRCYMKKLLTIQMFFFESVDYLSIRDQINVPNLSCTYHLLGYNLQR